MAVNPIIAQALQEQEASNVDPRIQAALDEQSNPVAAITEEPQYAWNPDAPISYEEEGALPLALAGAGKGGINVYKNIANMLGADSAPTIFAGEGEGLFGSLGLGMTDTSDEGLAASDEEYSGITDTTAGTVGEFIGEGAALAIPGIGYASKVSKLPTAMRILTSVGEGAIGGATLSDPGSRGTGALFGGTVGGGLTLGGAMGSRLLKGGLGKMKEAASDAIEYVTKSGQKRPSIPLILGTDPAEGAISSTTKSLADTMSLIPAAKGAVDRQIKELGTDFFEADLRKAFNYNKVVSDRVVKVLRETGDMQKAIEAGIGKSGRLPPPARILDAAARNAPEGRYSGQQLLKAAEDAVGAGKRTGATFREEALQRIKVLPRGDATMAGASTVASRDLLRQLTGSVARLVPGLGRAISTKGFQNFLLGNTGAQRMLQKALADKSGAEMLKVVTHIRRAIAAQAGPNTDVQDYANEQVQSLRGN